MFESALARQARIDAIHALLTASKAAISIATVSVLTFSGVDSTGTADSSSALQTASNQTAAAGQQLYYAAGQYKISNQINVPDGLVVQQSSQATLIGNITGTNLALASMFFAPIPASQAQTTLNSNASLNGTTISIVAASGIVAGSYIRILSVIGYSSIYQVESISGVGPFTVTLDRPLLYLYSTGDTVFRIASKPVSMQWYGNGGSITGKAAAFFSGCYWNTVKQGLNFRNLDGSFNNIDAFAGFNYGSYNCVMRFCRGDAQGGGTAFNAGFATDGESVGIEQCVVENGGGFCSGIKYADSRNCWDLNCRATGCLNGLALGSDVNNNVGCTGTRSMGGNYNNNTQNGVNISFGSSNNVFENLTASNNGSHGIQLDGTGTMTENLFSLIYANGNTGSGINVAAGVKKTRIDSIYTDANTAAGIATADELFIGFHECQASAVAAGVSCLSVTGTPPVSVEECNYVLSVSATFAVVLNAAGRLNISKGHITLNTNSVGLDSAVSGGLVSSTDLLIDIAGGATGTTGFFTAASGAKLTVGYGCDASLTATPVLITGGAPIAMTQDDGVEVNESAPTTGTQTLTQFQAKARVIRTTAALTGSLTINVPSGFTGAVYFFVNNTSNAQTASIGVSGGTSITVAQGNSAFVRTDETGANMKRMTADQALV